MSPPGTAPLCRVSSSVKNRGFNLRRSSFLFSLLLFPILNWWITPPRPQEIQIAASGNVKDVLTEIGHYVETRNPMTKVKLFFGTSEEVARQVESHATFDVYIGDDEDMAMLESKSYMVKESRVPLFMNQVVAVVAGDSEWDITEAKQLTPDNVKKIALMKESTKSGKMARQYLSKYGVLDALKDKIADAKSPKSCIETVKRGDARWTLVYSSDVARRKGLKILWRIPTFDLPAVNFSATRLTCSRNPEISARVIAALQSSIVRKMFENAGFQLVALPPDNRNTKKN